MLGAIGEFQTIEGKSTGIQKLSKTVFSELGIKLFSLKNKITFNQSSSKDYLSYKNRSVLRYITDKGNLTFQFFIDEIS
jgi:hypothetical protein